MSVSIPLIAPGGRVRVRRGTLPLDAALVGRTGTVIGASEYRPSRYDVSMDAGGEVRQFSPAELEVLDQPRLAPDRKAASGRRALP